MSKESVPDSTLDRLLTSHLQLPMEWAQPQKFDLSRKNDQAALEAQFVEGAITGVVDSVRAIADELYELRHPDKKDDQVTRAAFVQEILEKGASYGKWFLFPWSRQLVRYPDQEEHRALRTSRFKNLITEQEQRRLYDATVAIYGLSVGSSVVENLVSSGIGGTLILGDPDILAPSNLGRIKGGFTDVGSKKIDLVARKISETDPFIMQVHQPAGATPENLESLSLHYPDVSVLFDEVDSLSAKAQMRLFAQRERIPLVMATNVGELSIIDVERYDLERDARPFHGMLEENEVTKLAEGDVTREEIGALTIKLVGPQNISRKMMESYMEVGKTLPGIPQLGVTATQGGAYASIAARKIVLGQPLPSGRYMPPNQVFGA